MQQANSEAGQVIDFGNLPLRRFVGLSEKRSTHIFTNDCALPLQRNPGLRNVAVKTPKRYFNLKKNILAIYKFQLLMLDPHSLDGS